MSAVTEYFLVAAPANPSPRGAQQALQQCTSDYASVLTFEVPQHTLKVGTLDTLVSLSDDLTKLDSFAEGVTTKLQAHMSDILGKDQDKVREALLVNDRPYDAYASNFAWNTAKYNVNLSLKELHDELAQKLTQIDNDMKTKMQSYNKLKSNLQAFQRKDNGSLLIRSLNGLVDPKNFVLNSEFLTTLLVVIPKYGIKEWFEKYETLVPHYVVPRSSEQVSEDSEYVLVTVTLFRKAVDDFKARAREHKFVVRDFEFNPGEIEADQAEQAELRTEAQKKFNQLFSWCKIQFSEGFEAWFHIKALRIFVESVLRFGLPVNFYAAMLKPYRQGTSRGLRQALQQLYGHLDGGQANDVLQSDLEIAGLGSVLGTQEYFPYVSLSVNFSHWHL
eukprot:m.481569 g.481569  ORF g.481569 m.481569 type:complete len:389 (+) comp22228_c0_seq1:227-1393(+)